MTETTRAVVEEFFRRAGSGASPEHMAEMVSDDVDWFVAGDTSVVPWIGRKTGRAGVAEFYRQLRSLVTSERFDVSEVVVQDDRAIALGYLESRVKSTGKLIRSEFAFDFTIRAGRIVRFRLFEDSFAVAHAVACPVPGSEPR